MRDRGDECTGVHAIDVCVRACMRACVRCICTHAHLRLRTHEHT